MTYSLLPPLPNLTGNWETSGHQLKLLPLNIASPHVLLSNPETLHFSVLWGCTGKHASEFASKMEALFSTLVLNAIFNQSNISLWAPFARFWVAHQDLRVVGKRPPLKTSYAEKRPLKYERVITSVNSSSWRNVPGGQVMYKHKN